jgi:hypothetical protein
MLAFKNWSWPPSNIVGESWDIVVESPKASFQHIVLRHFSPPFLHQLGRFTNTSVAHVVGSSLSVRQIDVLACSEPLFEWSVGHSDRQQLPNGVASWSTCPKNNMRTGQTGALEVTACFVKAWRRFYLSCRVFLVYEKVKYSAVWQYRRKIAGSGSTCKQSRRRFALDRTEAPPGHGMNV